MESLKIKNTFAPLVDNKELTVGQIVILLFRQLVKYKDLPPEVQDLVDQYQKEHAK